MVRASLRGRGEMAPRAGEIPWLGLSRRRRRPFPLLGLATARRFRGGCRRTMSFPRNFHDKYGGTLVQSHRRRKGGLPRRPRPLRSTASIEQVTWPGTETRLRNARQKTKTTQRPLGRSSHRRMALVAPAGDVSAEKGGRVENKGPHAWHNCLHCAPRRESPRPAR